MASFDDSPGENWFPAGQHLVYTCGTQTTPLPADYRYIIQVEENGTEISKIYLTPNTAEKGFFDLSEVVRGRVEVDAFKYQTTATVHSFNNKPFTRSNNNVKRYTVRLGYYESGTENLDETIRRCTSSTGTSKFRTAFILRLLTFTERKQTERYG